MRRGVAALAAILAGAATPTATAHSFYDSACCSDHDCHPAEPGEVVPVEHGWKVVPTGEVFTEGMVFHSPDGRFHRCSEDGRRDGRTICLYVPDFAM